MRSRLCPVSPRPGIACAHSISRKAVVTTAARRCGSMNLQGSRPDMESVRSRRSALRVRQSTCWLARTAGQMRREILSPLVTSATRRDTGLRRRCLPKCTGRGCWNVCGVGSGTRTNTITCSRSRYSGRVGAAGHFRYGRTGSLVPSTQAREFIPRWQARQDLNPDTRD